MKFILLVSIAAALAVAIATDPPVTDGVTSEGSTSATSELTTIPSTDNTSTTTAASTTTTTAATTTTTTAASTTTTTAEPTTSTTPHTTSTSTVAPTTSEAPTTTTPSPHTEPTEGTYIVKNGDVVCAYVIMKVVVTQNSTRVPFVNGTVMEGDSKCSDGLILLSIRTFDNNQLKLIFGQEKSNYYVEEIRVKVKPDIVAGRSNLTQFSTPNDRFYKCTQASEVSLESDVKVIFSDMKYQAFKETKKAEFVGTELECAPDAHSDVIIIAIGCALAVLVVVILVAYLIARRTHRQRGYQSV